MSEGSVGLIISFKLFKICAVLFAGIKHKANGIMAGLRQFDIELGTFFDQKGVRQLKEDTRAVAGIHIGALSAAVVHIAQHH